MDIAQLIQKQVPLGSLVIFTLKTGQEITGTLFEMSRNHVSIEQIDGITTLLIDAIGSWKVVSVENLDQDTPASSTSTHVEEETPSPDIYNDITIEARNALKAIQIRFEARLDALQILEPISPDFAIEDEEFRIWQKSSASTIWHSAKSKYEYAVKVNELSGKFGRIQPIIAQLKTIEARYPRSLAVKRQMSFLDYLSGNLTESIRLLEEVSVASDATSDWRNLAAMALRREMKEFAHLALHRMFLGAEPLEQMPEWYWYIYLSFDLGVQAQVVKLVTERATPLSPESTSLVANSIAFLLLRDSREGDAIKFLQQFDATLSVEYVDKLFIDSVTALYQTTADKLTKPKNKEFSPQVNSSTQLRKGRITRYLADRNYGFLVAENGTNYFFHRTSVFDEKLIEKLLGGSLRLDVTFEHTDGPKGPVAVAVSLARSVDQIFELAREYVADAEYPKAIAQIKKVLSIDPEYPKAQELYELWRSYARNTGVPQGSNPYAKAKRVQLIEKDLDRAIELFKRAIKSGDNLESAVKDLAAVYVQVGQPENAIKVLNQHRTKVSDPQTVDNLLIGFYQRAEQYDEAIELLSKQLSRAKTIDKKSHFLIQIGTCYLRQQNYASAETQFRDVLKLQPHNQVTRRNLAVCLLNQDKLDDAEKLLNHILDVTLDDKAAELLKVVQQTRLTGHSSIIQIETVQSISASAVSELAEFFLERCTFQGVRADHLRDGHYDTTYAEADIQALERLGSELRTSRPRERAAFYLSASKIYLLKDDNAPSEQFYRHLSRSFASSGDSFLSEGRHLNAIQEMYCEALAVYDGVQISERGRGGEFQDAVNATVRYVASLMGSAYIPRSPELSLNTLDDVINKLFQTHPQLHRAFDMLVYLTLRSRYAMERVLRSIHKQIQAKSTFQAQLRSYLEAKVTNTKKIEKLDDLIDIWKEVRRRFLDDYRSVASILRLVGEFEIKTASIENCIEQLKSGAEYLVLDLDQERFRQLSRILNLLLDLCRQDTFDDQDRLCLNVKLVSEQLVDEIENNPTKLSVEEIIPLLNTILGKVFAWQENLYQTSTPQLGMRVPLESFTPDRQEQIEIQVVVENRKGCSPAETLELVIQEDRDLFQVVQPSVTLESSLRGGEQRILRVPVKVTAKAQKSETFSLPVYAQYTTRSGETERTRVNSFPILLYSKDDFADIHNPYSEYAEGGIVGNPSMFYGRGDLLARVAATLKESRSQSKCVVIYGQKRAGKSSILYHLTKEIEGDNTLTLDVGNIASVIDENSKIPVLYQILWSILRKLRNAIEDRVDAAGYSELSLVLPNDIDFYNHPTPLQYFVDLFGDFQRKALREDRWNQIRPVVLIDEFSYVFDQINKGRLSSEFMKNWKALLQNNFFNAVLVGQDVMPKFKDRFPNEFGTTQDEQVSYLRREDAIRLIEDPIRLEDGSSRYREKAIERILDLTAGSPFYIQIICNRLVQYMNRKRVRLVTDADVEQIKAELITGASSLGRDKFDNLINSGDTSPDAIIDQDIISVLASIAVNSRTGPCSRSSIACETKASIDDILEDLVRRRVLERERDSYYRITVGLFKDWLIVHQG